jgi:predicted nucleotidyltransferase
MRGIDRDAVLARVTDALEGMDGLVFAALFGSASEGGPFRDVDVALYVDRETVPADQDFRIAVEWGARLTRVAGVDVDVCVINDAPVALCYNVTKGVPLFEADPEAWPNFRERTWTVYLDMLPFFNAYFAEAAS